MDAVVYELVLRARRHSRNDLQPHTLSCSLSGSTKATNSRYVPSPNSTRAIRVKPPACSLQASSGTRAPRSRR